MAACLLALFAWTSTQISLLDHPRYRVRLQAEVRLLPVLALCGPQLEARRAGAGLEASRRAGRLLDLREELAAEYLARWRSTRLPEAWALATFHGRLPWLDAPTENWTPFLWLAYSTTGPGYRAEYEDYSHYRLATRLWLAWRLACGEPWESTLRRLWDAEACWRLRREPEWFAFGVR